MQTKAEIDQVLREASDAKDIPGVVAIAASGSRSGPRFRSRYCNPARSLPHQGRSASFSVGTFMRQV